MPRASSALRSVRPPYPVVAPSLDWAADDRLDVALPFVGASPVTVIGVPAMSSSAAAYSGVISTAPSSGSRLGLFGGLFFGVAAGLLGQGEIVVGLALLVGLRLVGVCDRGGERLDVRGRAGEGEQAAAGGFIRRADESEKCLEVACAERLGKGCRERFGSVGRRGPAVLVPCDEGPGVGCVRTGFHEGGSLGEPRERAVIEPAANVELLHRVEAGQDAAQQGSIARLEGLG